VGETISHRQWIIFMNDGRLPVYFVSHAKSPPQNAHPRRLSRFIRDLRQLTPLSGQGILPARAGNLSADAGPIVPFSAGAGIG